MRLFALMLLLSASSFLRAQSAPANPLEARPWALMPVPAKIQAGNGQWVVQQGLTIYLGGDPSCTGSRRRGSAMGLTVSISEGGDPRLGAATLRFVDHLSRATGISLRYQPGNEDKATIAIHCEHSGEKVQKLGEDESYVLDVTQSGVKLSAPTTLGVIHGLQTLLQLVGPTQQGFAAPAIHIEDAPRFPWRGLLLDACRHWMPVEVVKRTLDGMEAVKMNVLHFHLSEYQGFRVESKRFPKLQEMGSNGFYYTQDEIKDVISYARDRGVRVVPEFDMPGHSTSWFVGYPELAAGPGPYQIEKRWGVFDPAMDPTKESTYKFLDKFIGEMAELFPDDFFHLGGDEVNGKQWDANPEIQKFKKLHNLKTNGDLQAYFNQRVVKIIEKYKKTPIGWDEVLHPDLPKDVVVQSWRGPESEAKAVQAGHRALLSHGYYLDLAESAEKHYLVDPLSGDAANLSPEQQKMILGGEACMWSEMVTPENVDSRLWPRNAAIAERLWSPADVRDVSSMYQRLDVMSDRLDTLGLTHHSALRMMQERLAPDNLQALRTLADTVEPAKGYHRGSLQKYNADAPLNGLPDSIPPECIPARNFALLVDRLVAGNPSADDLGSAHDLMDAWRLNQERLAPAFQNLPLSDDVQVSQDLSVAGNIGLQALDLFTVHTPAPAGWPDQQIVQLEEMKKRDAEVLLMIVPPIEKLVQAVGK